MPLRRRLTVAAAVAVAVAVALACTVAYLAVRGELRGQVDDALLEQAQRTQEMPLPGPFDFARRSQDVDRLGRRFPGLPPRRGGTAPYLQLVSPDGRALAVRGEEIPVDARTKAVAAGKAGRFLTDARSGDTHLRVIAVPWPGGGAVQIARSLNSVDSVLARMRVILLLVCLGGVALAVALGRLVSRNVVAPIVSVTEAARHIAATEDLGRRIEVRSADEVGELAQHFNAMLATLEASLAAQRQLIADASHELRTPITSLRTNIEVLADSEGLASEERARLLADVEEQVAELGALVADLIELARGDAPRVRFSVDVEPAVVEGTRERLARAVNNLLDNAATHSSPGGVVEVSAGAWGVRGRDHGGGIAPEDLPPLFDRFYRGASARGRPR